MDANSVVHDLLHDKIISDGDYQDITTTRGRNQQNRFLHLSLKKCTDEVFENACEIFIKSGEDGNARMKALGEQMVAALNEAKDQSLVTGVCECTHMHTVYMCVCVYMCVYRNVCTCGVGRVCGGNVYVTLYCLYEIVYILERVAVRNILSLILWLPNCSAPI